MKTNTYKKRRGVSEATKAKRAKLCLLSQKAKAILETIEQVPLDSPLRMCSKVNDVLMYWHSVETGQANPDCWHTFKGWKDLGFSVQKGENGFLIWGQPRKMKTTTEQPVNGGSNDKGDPFNPDCPYQKLAMIKRRVKRMPLLLPAPEPAATITDLQTISEDDFWQTYQPIPNHLNSDAGWSDDEAGYLFETYGEELEFVREQDPNTVWTLVEGDTSQFISSGYHLVNRLGYFITKRPFKNATHIEIEQPTVSPDEPASDIIQGEFCFESPEPEQPKHRGRADYYERQEAKLERAEELAEKHNNASDQRYKAFKATLDPIPFGQPILVGHHSEKGHRAALRRADNHMRQSIEHGHKSEYYNHKAASIERTLEGKGAISSDAPDAVERLQEKIKDAEESQTLMKAANAAIRKYRKAGKKAQLDALVELGLTEAQARQIIEPDFCGRIGFAPYQLQNNNANIRRMKQRVKSLESTSAETTERTEKGVRIIENVEENRIQLVFDGKPSEEIRKLLKGRGFRWSRRSGAWQRLLNSNGIYAAKSLIESL